MYAESFSASRRRVLLILRPFPALVGKVLEPDALYAGERLIGGEARPEALSLEVRQHVLVELVEGLIPVGADLEVLLTHRERLLGRGRLDLALAQSLHELTELGDELLCAGLHGGDFLLIARVSRRAARERRLARLHLGFGRLLAFREVIPLFLHRGELLLQLRVLRLQRSVFSAELLQLRDHLGADCAAAATRFLRAGNAAERRRERDKGDGREDRQSSSQFSHRYSGVRDDA
jgi:hypothetical protein